MNFRLFALCVMMVVPAFAGRIVTYTATSNVSQEEANNAAIAGVAKQISSQIEANQVMSKNETEINGKSNFKQTYKAQNKVFSDLKLKGIEITTVKTDDGFKATAKLDLDIFTADLQLKLKTLQHDISELEEEAKNALNARNYSNAIKALEKGQPMVLQHQKVLDQLSQVYPVNENHRLRQNLAGIETLIVDRLSKIKIEGPSEQFELIRPEMPAWEVTVYDEFGPLPNFPLIARQGRHTLSERRTQNTGSATFNLRNVNFSSGPYIIYVEANLPMTILRDAGIQNSIEISYTVSQSKCSVQIQCNMASSICNAIESGLSKASVFNSTNTGAPKITAETSAQIKNSLGSLTSYNMDVILKGDNIMFSRSTKGAGKNEVDALVKAINKMDFTDIKKQIGSTCK